MEISGIEVQKKTTMNNEIFSVSRLLHCPLRRQLARPSLVLFSFATQQGPDHELQRFGYKAHSSKRKATQRKLIYDTESYENKGKIKNKITKQKAPSPFHLFIEQANPALDLGIQMKRFKVANGRLFGQLRLSLELFRNVSWQMLGSVLGQLANNTRPIRSSIIKNAILNRASMQKLDLEMEEFSNQPPFYSLTFWKE